MHIHMKEVTNHDVELAIGNPHLHPRAVQAGLGVSDREPPQISGAKGVEEQCA